MFTTCMRAGLNGIKKRPGLVGLVYLGNLTAAAFLAVPVYAALSDVVGPSGFGPSLARAFDVVLWADIVEKVEPVFQAVRAQLVWMVPFYLVWKAALSVGLIHALRVGVVRSFWQGVGRYTVPATLLGGLFLAMVLLWSGLLAVLAVVASALGLGEVGTFWTLLVALPSLVVAGLALLDLMHDYARMALVVSGQSVWKAWRTGLAWPFRHGTAVGLYAVWFVVAAGLLVAPSMMAAAMAAGWGLFFAQQLPLLARAAVTVGWFGSEVTLYERVRWAEAPLIAGEAGQQPEEDAPASGLAPA